MPLEIRMILPDDAVRVHASPGKDDGLGIRPVMSDTEIAARTIDGADADLIFVGHTHSASTAACMAGAFNLGSVNLQTTPDLRASYVLLEADTVGYHLQHQKVDYDHQQVIEQARAIKHPALIIITVIPSASLFGTLNSAPKQACS